MPFGSASQRRLFWGAKKDPKVRKAHGISKAVADKMTAHDTGGPLPSRVIHHLSRAQKRTTYHKRG